MCYYVRRKTNVFKKHEKHMKNWSTSIQPAADFGKSTLNMNLKTEISIMLKSFLNDV